MPHCCLRGMRGNSKRGRDIRELSYRMNLPRISTTLNRRSGTEVGGVRGNETANEDDRLDGHMVPVSPIQPGVMKFGTKRW